MNFATFEERPYAIRLAARIEPFEGQATSGEAVVRSIVGRLTELEIPFLLGLPDETGAATFWLRDDEKFDGHCIDVAAVCTMKAMEFSDEILLAGDEMNLDEYVGQPNVLRIAARLGVREGYGELTVVQYAEQLIDGMAARGIPFLLGLPDDKRELTVWLPADHFHGHALSISILAKRINGGESD